MRRRLLGIALLISVLAALAGLTWLLVQEDSPLFRPIKQYEILSEVQYVKPAEIDAILTPYLGRSFWEVELEAIQSELVRLDWISSAQVKRSWPDHLYVTVQEQKPVARWAETGLVNQAGAVFYPKELAEFNHLVVLEGPLAESTSMLVRLAKFQTALKPLEFRISALSLTLNGVLTLSLVDGSTIVLDKSGSDAKLTQFIRAYSKLSTTLTKSPQLYDLRYSNGFIVGEP